MRALLANETLNLLFKKKHFFLLLLCDVLMLSCCCCSCFLLIVTCKRYNFPLDKYYFFFFEHTYSYKQMSIYMYIYAVEHSIPPVIINWICDVFLVTPQASLRVFHKSSWIWVSIWSAYIHIWFISFFFISSFEFLEFYVV